MKRGFVLTVIAFILFTTLVFMVMQMRVERQKVSSWAQDMLVARKLLYTTDDISDDVRLAYGVRIARSGIALTFTDTLPANYSIDRNLRGYRDFLQQKYTSSELSVQFYNTSGSAIALDQMPTDLVVRPYNLTYHYADYGQHQLSLYCAPNGYCNNTDIRSVSFEFTLPNSNFTWLPTAGNASHYAWSPNSLNCSGQAACINFTLGITDSRGSKFSCPSSICNYSTFRSDQDSLLTVQMSPCWIDLRLGNNGITSINIRQSGNASASCNATLNSVISPTFPAQSYYLELPALVRVNDTNYNASRIYQLPGENISSRELTADVPSRVAYLDSECFNSDITGAYAGGSSYRYIYGVRFANVCTEKNIHITNITVSWVVNGGQHIEIVRINNTNVWHYDGSRGSPSGRQHSGTPIDILDWTIRPVTTIPLSYLRFQENMRNKNITLNLTFSDNSTSIVRVPT